MSNLFLNSRISKGLPTLLTLCILAAPITSSAQDTVIQMIKRNAPSFAIDGNNGSTNAQDVYLWSKNDKNANQQWIEIDRGNNYYSYQKLNTNHCLDGGRGGENEQNVYLWSCDDRNQNQHWLKVDVGDGHYRLEKRNAPGFSIDGNRGGENAQSVYLYDSNDENKNQHWLFNVVNTGTNNNENTNNDDCINVDSLNELSGYLDVNNQCIRVEPGTYRFDTNNVGEGKLFSNNYVLRFSG